jgi:1-aminocyclopropane-1-carboxylate deaminase/D-cysteine desulfhydrase-like pyridoxal-dependent ACC family enzyme
MAKKSDRTLDKMFLAVKSQCTVASMMAELSKLDPFALISFDIVKDKEVFTTDVIPKIYTTEMKNVRVEIDSRDYTYIFSTEKRTLDQFIKTDAEIIKLKDKNE